jgi:uncharacterized protein YndB with AHSA1/START domain
MTNDLIAKATATIEAPVPTVWEALTNPSIIKKYMFDTNVVSDWKEGSSIVWKGIWKEKPYEDKGTILKIEREKMLQVTHFSPLMGMPDLPENYHTLTYELTEEDGKTQVTLTQDNNKSEESRTHSEQMWETMLESLKKLLEE